MKKEKNVNLNFHNVSKEEESLQLAFKDLISFGKLFLPDDFLRSETPPFPVSYTHLTLQTTPNV